MKWAVRLGTMFTALNSLLLTAERLSPGNVNHNMKT